MNPRSQSAAAMACTVSIKYIRTHTGCFKNSMPIYILFMKSRSSLTYRIFLTSKGARSIVISEIKSFQKGQQIIYIYFSLKDVRCFSDRKASRYQILPSRSLSSIESILIDTSPFWKLNTQVTELNWMPICPIHISIKYR